MKFSILPILIAGAGIAQHVSASPIRVIVTEVSPNIRLGHAVAHVDNNSNVAHIPIVDTTQVDAGRQRRPHRKCGGMHAKALAISNAFRKALGFPVIEGHPHPHTDGEKEIHGGLIRILPMPFIGTPVTVDGQVEDKPHHHHQHSKPHPKHKCGSFMRRIHNALMALGPWEGRAVAFVIGCGIGVLLRMVWVLSVVSYRMIRGEKDEETQYSEIVFEHDAEQYMVAPPRYNDEKVEAVVDNKPPAI